MTNKKTPETVRETGLGESQQFNKIRSYLEFANGKKGGRIPSKEIAKRLVKVVPDANRLLEGTKAKLGRLGFPPDYIEKLVKSIQSGKYTDNPKVKENFANLKKCFDSLNEKEIAQMEQKGIDTKNYPLAVVAAYEFNRLAEFYNKQGQEQREAKIAEIKEQAKARERKEAASRDAELTSVMKLAKGGELKLTDDLKFAEDLKDSKLKILNSELERLKTLKIAKGEINFANIEARLTSEYQVILGLTDPREKEQKLTTFFDNLSGVILNLQKICLEHLLCQKLDLYKDFPASKPLEEMVSELNKENFTFERVYQLSEDTFLELATVKEKKGYTWSTEKLLAKANYSVDGAFESLSASDRYVEALIKEFEKIQKAGLVRSLDLGKLRAVITQEFKDAKGPDSKKLFYEGTELVVRRLKTLEMEHTLCLEQGVYSKGDAKYTNISFNLETLVLGTTDPANLELGSVVFMTNTGLEAILGNIQGYKSAMGKEWDATALLQSNRWNVERALAQAKREFSPEDKAA